MNRLTNYSGTFEFPPMPRGVDEMTERYRRPGMCESAWRLLAALAFYAVLILGMAAVFGGAVGMAVTAFRFVSGR